MFTKGVDKKKTTARAMDKTTQPVVSPLSKTFHKDGDYSTVTTKFYGDDADIDQTKGEDHSSKVKRLLETIKKVTLETAKANNDRDILDEEMEKMNKRKIGPFQFDIDNEIDTEILKNDEVYKDLKELDENIIKTNKLHSSLVTKSFGRRKKRK